MNFTTISSSEITSPTAAYIFGELAANPNALNEKESIDIVKALFGIRTTDPTTIDITEAMVKSLSTVQSNTIRTMLQDRSISGIIWRFTTPKKFMVELEKIPTSGGHHALNLILVYINRDTKVPSTFVRQLVRFDKNGVTWFNKEMSELDYSARNYNILVKLHDEAVSKLSDKYLKPKDPNEPKAPPKQHFKLEGRKVYTFEVHGSNIKVLNTLTGIEMFSFDGADLVQTLKAHGPTIVYEDVNVVLPDDSSKDIIDRINKAIENPEEQQEPEPPKEEEPAPSPSPTEPEPTPEPEPPKPHEVLHPQPPPPEEKSTDEEKKTDEVVEKALSSSSSIIFNFRKGDIVTFSKVEGDDGTICRIEGDTSFVEIADPNFGEGFIFGKYRVKEDISEAVAAEYEQLHEFMELFELVEGQTTVKVDGREMTVGIDTGKPEEQPHFELPKEIPPMPSELIVKKAEEALQVARETGATEVPLTVDGQTIGTLEVPPQSTEETNNMAEITVVIDPSFKDIEATLTDIVKQTISENPGATDAEVTEAVKTCAEIDEIKVEFKDGVWNVLPDVMPDTHQEPEVPTIDLNDINNQLNMLRGLFGVTDPAITHVEKFLKNHLTEENNAGFLKTGTFPTETTIIYTQKPYDVTVSILKYKDGRFYRVMWAKTDLSLGEAANHGYLATSDIQGRWVRLGRDVQNNVFRPEQRGRRY